MLGFIEGNQLLQGFRWRRMLRVILKIPKISIDSKFEFMKKHLKLRHFQKHGVVEV